MFATRTLARLTRTDCATRSGALLALAAILMLPAAVALDGVSILVQLAYAVGHDLARRLAPTAHRTLEAARRYYLVILGVAYRLRTDMATVLRWTAQAIDAPRGGLVDTVALAPVLLPCVGTVAVEAPVGYWLTRVDAPPVSEPKPATVDEPIAPPPTPELTPTRRRARKTAPPMEVMPAAARETAHDDDDDATRYAQAIAEAGSLRAAARVMGLSESTLRSRCKRLGVATPSHKAK